MGTVNISMSYQELINIVLGFNLLVFVEISIFNYIESRRTLKMVKESGYFVFDGMVHRTLLDEAVEKFKEKDLFNYDKS